MFEYSFVIDMVEKGTIRNPEQINFTPQVEVITGCMYSGKTGELQRRIRRARIAGQLVQVFKPRGDTRSDGVESHDGNIIDAVDFESVEHLRELINSDTDVVAIDEVQFASEEIVDFVNELVNSGIHVILAGLDTDFRGLAFGPMSSLLAQAERVDKLHALCMECGDDASWTQRIVNGNPAKFDDPIVVIGATDLYEARCRTHHDVPKDS